jgi:hypothetical protein
MQALTQTLPTAMIRSSGAREPDPKTDPFLGDDDV